MGRETPTRFVNQWYCLFCAVSTLLCLMSMVRSVFLLLYVEALDSQASFLFVCRHLDYFGEPSVRMLTAIAVLLSAIIVWIFANYGKPMGLAVALGCAHAIQQSILSLMYITDFVNPFTSKDTRYQKELRKVL